MSQDRITKLARGQSCQVRLPGICNGNPDTTVLAHFRMAGISGFGVKGASIIGAWACSDCHDAIDRRRHTALLTRDEVRLMHLEGVIRTQTKLIEMGILKLRAARLEIAARIMAGLASNPAVIAQNDQCGWCLVNCKDSELAGYAVKLANELMIANAAIGVGGISS